MSEMTNTAKQVIQAQLRRLDWMIPDAQRRLAGVAQEMLRRAQNAVNDTEAMLANQPCCITWVDFAECDLRNAREAKAELTKLYEQQKMLRFFLKSE
ncbi:hypothetical protein SH501x_001348 [Pirellulaceae bacterium SH501]